MGAATRSASPVGRSFHPGARRCCGSRPAAAQNGSRSRCRLPGGVRARAGLPLAQHGAEDPVDERRRVGAAEPLGGLDRLVDRALGGDRLLARQLVGCSISARPTRRIERSSGAIRSSDQPLACRGSARRARAGGRARACASARVKACASRGNVSSSGRPSRSLWYSAQTAARRCSVLRDGARDVLARARVDPDHVADVDEQRHLDPGARSRAPPAWCRRPRRCRRATRARSRRPRGRSRSAAGRRPAARRCTAPRPPRTPSSTAARRRRRPPGSSAARSSRSP